MPSSKMVSWDASDPAVMTYMQVSRLRKMTDCFDRASQRCLRRRAKPTSVASLVQNALRWFARVRHLRRPCARDEVAELQRRVTELERLATIAVTTACIRETPINRPLLVSVIMPTCDQERLPWLRQAVASVQGQSYDRWELLIIENGGMDGAPLVADEWRDERIRIVRTPKRGIAAARNVGLTAAGGDVITYLDDDNRFDRDWLKAVVWTFEREPAATVLYGARIVDGGDIQHNPTCNGLPWLRFLSWDRVAMEKFNRIDMNVLAHRRVPTVRFNEAISVLCDWDLVLKLTDETDPVDLPVIATYYTTTAPNRLMSREGSLRLAREYVVVRLATARRRRSIRERSRTS